MFLKQITSYKVPWGVHIELYTFKHQNKDYFILIADNDYLQFCLNIDACAHPNDMTGGHFLTPQDAEKFKQLGKMYFIYFFKLIETYDFIGLTFRTETLLWTFYQDRIVDTYYADHVIGDLKHIHRIKTFPIKPWEIEIAGELPVDIPSVRRKPLHDYTWKQWLKAQDDI